MAVCNCMLTFCAMRISFLRINDIEHRVSTEKKEDLITTGENCTDWFSSRPTCARIGFENFAHFLPCLFSDNLESGRTNRMRTGRRWLLVRGKAGGSASRVREGTNHSTLLSTLCSTRIQLSTVFSTLPLGQVVPLYLTPATLTSVLWHLQLFCTACCLVGAFVCPTQVKAATLLCIFLWHNVLHRALPIVIMKMPIDWPLCKNARHNQAR